MVRSSFVSAAVLALSALAVAACAPAPAPLDASGAPRECFFANRADSYSDGGDNLILVRDGARGVFEIQVTGVCPDIDWSRRLMAGLKDKRGFIDKDRLDLSERQAVEYWMKRWGVTREQLTAAHRKAGRMTKDIAAELGKKR
jgi:hypothetical protein